MQIAPRFDPLVTRAVYALLDRRLESWWLDHGSLLGCIRTGNYLPWDGDIDVGCWFLDDEALDGLMRDIKKEYPSAFFDPLAGAVKIPFGTHIGEVWSIDIAFYKRQCDLAMKSWPNLPQFSKLQMFAYMCLTRSQQRDLGRQSGHGWRRAFWSIVVGSATLGSRVVPARAKAGFVRTMVRVFRFPSRANAVPAGHFASTSTRMLAGLRLPVPHDPEAYLKYRYGEQWQVEKRQWNYLMDDGGLVE